VRRVDIDAAERRREPRQARQCFAVQLSLPLSHLMLPFGVSSFWSLNRASTRNVPEAVLPLAPNRPFAVQPKPVFVLVIEMVKRPAELTL
jgi:hypothetical protein